ncbi:MAG: hypothetical protein E7035_01510 [Verrucomicrobiaceae bacterium]|nr:hypothetical protein [Verrucomicrobiaceae bacterium]
MTDSSPDAVQIGIFVMCVAFFVNIAVGIVHIINTFRRKPSIDQTLRSYVTHAEFEHHILEENEDFKRIEGDIKTIRSYNAKTTREIFDELRKMNAGFNKEFQDINKAIGRIEGTIENIAKKEFYNEQK